MNDEQVAGILLSAAEERNGKKVLPCAEAFRLAGRHKIELDRIAAVCNSAGIKIVHCQLGCFK